MTVDELIAKAQDSLSGRRAYAEPYERDGITIIPAAAVRGGGGGGSGHEEGSDGEGGGFGMDARPTGAYVIADGHVSWKPAVDVNRLVATAGAVAALALWTRRRRPPGARGAADRTAEPPHAGHAQTRRKGRKDGARGRR